MLAIENLTVSYGTEIAVKNVSLTVSGEVVCLCGRNGSGKSTLLKAVAGIVGIDSGRILLDGRDVVDLPLHRRLEAGIGYVPEDRKLFSEMTVRENVEVARIGAKAAGREVMDVDQFLPELARFYDRKSKLLSGGQQKMVSIARAIVASPQVLLFDELLEGLAQAMCYKICDAVKGLKAEGKDILCAESSLDKASLYADRVIWLEQGKIVAMGTPDEIKSQMMEHIRKMPADRKLPQGEA
ncbi:MAG: ATP-binding cassette domain-containing protein [Firmicutes bacterium]|nr:ATP-binding cassette domain-containing protein [Bacillota bacterium]